MNIVDHDEVDQRVIDYIRCDSNLEESAWVYAMFLASEPTCFRRAGGKYTVGPLFCDEQAREVIFRELQAAAERHAESKEGK